MDQIQTAITAILPYAITGAVISGVTQYVKKFIDSTGHKRLACLGLSIVGGLVVYALGFVPHDWIIAALGVWAAANSVYLGTSKWFEPTPAVAK